MPDILADLVTPGLVIMIGAGGFAFVTGSISTRITDVKDSVNARIDTTTTAIAEVKQSVERHRSETREDHKANGQRLTQLADEIHEAGTWQATHRAEHLTKGL